MKPQATTTYDWVENLDDATLRSGHAVLDDGRIRDFDRDMDLRLEQLERRFRDFCTHHSVRKSLGR
jgi:hypothetical protein